MAGRVYESRRMTLLSASIGAALAATATASFEGMGRMNYLGCESTFDYGTSGVTASAYVQTSFDSGVTWIDVMSFVYSAASGVKFAAVTTSGVAQITPTSGTLSNNTEQNGVLGDSLRVLYSSSGDHGAGVDFKIVGVAKV